MEEAESKKKYQIGTFSDKLGTGLSSILSEEMLEEARKIVALDKSNIIRDVSNQIDRLDSFIKKEIGAIPRIEDLANWMFDKKKLTQTGDFFPKITDEEIIEYSKKYVALLKRKTTSAIRLDTKIKTFQWLGTPEQLSSLYAALAREGFICRALL